MGRKRAANTNFNSNRGGYLNHAVDTLILWGVVVLFFPLVLAERWRRGRARRSAHGPNTERAIHEALRKLKLTMHGVEGPGDADNLSSQADRQRADRKDRGSA